MNRFARFMYGRNGTDHLSLFLVILGCIITFLPWNILDKIPICDIIGLAVTLWGLFRVFSKKVAARRLENERFLRIWYAIKNFFIRIFKPRADAKTHRIFRCPACRQKVRVPRGKGKIAITCPKCAHKFTRKS